MDASFFPSTVTNRVAQHNDLEIRSEEEIQGNRHSGISKTYGQWRGCPAFSVLRTGRYLGTCASGNNGGRSGTMEKFRDTNPAPSRRTKAADVSVKSKYCNLTV